MFSDNLVTQSNQLARGFRSEVIPLREQKVFYTLISMIEPTDTEFKEYRIPMDGMYELMGLAPSKSPREIEKTIYGLVKRTLSLPTDDNNPHSFTIMSIISSGWYDRATGEATFTLNEHLKPYLLQLKEDFHSYRLFNILKLQGTHSISLFQFFKSYQHTGEVEITLDNLRLFLFGKVDTYPEYTVLKRKVLVPSIEEINQLTDLDITFDEIKEGRSVQALRFHIEEKTSEQLTLL